MIQCCVIEPPHVRPLPWSDEEFAETVKPHLPAAVAAAAAVLGCEHHAWDAVQEALLALWREPQPPPNLRAWLLRAVRNRSLHLRRTCTRHRRRDARAAADRSECRCEDDPCRILGDRELVRLIEQACLRLPQELREVFRLREVENLDYQAIARRMRAPIGTVRSRLSRARQALKSYVGEFLSATN
jgi:RNA polymerase sigma-70 factor (ECF subfamily)